MAANEKQFEKEQEDETVWVIRDGYGEIEFVGSEQETVQAAMRIVLKDLGLDEENEGNVRTEKVLE